MTDEFIAQTEMIIKVNGSALSAEIMDALIDLVVEDDLAQPGMFILRFHDPIFALSDGSQFSLGAEVQIAAQKGSGAAKTIFTGEIIALEPEFAAFEKNLVVRGYDKAHRLYRGRKIRTFLKKTDSEIASAIAQENGLTATVTSTSPAHEYVIQHNQTDMEFLRERAARVGFQTFVLDKKLYFTDPESSPPAAPDQELGMTLISFNARLSAAGQPNTVIVRGWDPKAKAALVATQSSATPPSSIGFGKTPAAAAQAAFGSSATLDTTDWPIGVQGEGLKLAQSIYGRIASDYLAAEGVCMGEAALKAGTKVKVLGVGTKFGGTYFVSATRHEYSPEQGYLTTFFTHGRRPHSMAGILGESAPRPLIHSLVIGIVTNSDDPDGLGRVKIKFPWLSDEHESHWAPVVSAGGGPQRGLMLVPEVNDQVLVGFEQGDMNYPYVLGGIWNTKDKPPATAVAEKKVKLRTFKTRNGHTLEFTDDEGANKGGVVLKTAGGQTLTISDTDKGLSIKSTKHTIALDDQGNAVKMTSGGTFELTASGHKISIAQSGLEISGPGGKLSIASAGVELSANSNMTVKANANCDLQANAMMNVKSSAILNIQGTLVKIN